MTRRPGRPSASTSAVRRSPPHASAADGSVLAMERAPSPADGSGARRSTRWSSSPARSARARCVAVGIGAAGLVDSADGVLRFAPNLAWRDVPLVDHVDAGAGAARRSPTTTPRPRPGASSVFGAGRGSPAPAAGDGGDRDRRRHRERRAALSGARTASPPRSVTSSWSRAGRPAGAATGDAGSRWPRGKRSSGPVATAAERYAATPASPGSPRVMPARVTGPMVTARRAGRR